LRPGEWAVGEGWRGPSRQHNDFAVQDNVAGVFPNGLEKLGDSELTAARVCRGKISTVNSVVDSRGCVELSSEGA